MALGIAGGDALADHLAARVHRAGALKVPPRVPRSTIPPVSVQENAWLGIAGDGAGADHLAAGVHRTASLKRAAEGAEVDHPACLRPGERMGLGIAGDAAEADHLAAGVHRAAGL